jgi:hypothetical protein
MTKPSEVIKWAEDAGAVKEVTTSTQWELGWRSLPDNLPGQDEELPLLDYVNYWQNAVQIWIEYLEANIPDLTQTNTWDVYDLWGWDRGNVVPFVAPGPQASDPPYCFIIFGSSNVLGFACSVEPPVSTSSFSDQVGDIYVGSRFLELWDIFSQGLGIQIVDANDAVWTIYFDTGGGTLSTSKLYINTGGVGDCSGDASGGTVDMDVYIDKTFFGFKALKDGVEQSDFSSFGLLDSSNFSTKNPNGVRVVRIGASEYVMQLGSFKNILPTPNKPVRRIIFPLEVGYQTSLSTGTTRIVCKVDPEKNYKIIIDASFASTKTGFIQIQELTSGNFIHTMSAVSSFDGSAVIHFSPKAESITLNMPTFNYLSASAANGTSVNDRYRSPLFYKNYIVLEEL